MFCMTEPSLAKTKKRPNPSVRLLTKPQLQHCLASVHSLTADGTAQIQSGAEGKNSRIIREEAMRGLKCYSSLCREYPQALQCPGSHNARQQFLAVGSCTFPNSIQQLKN